MKLRDISEQELIEKLFSDFAVGDGVLCGVGDDAAVLDFGAPCLLLYSIDTLVEEVHFRWKYTSAADLGYKALAVNVSDITAMGGISKYATVSLATPADTTLQVVEQLYMGLREAATDYGVYLVGGDTVRSPQHTVVSVSLVGTVGRGKVLYRDGAQVGDQIYVSGYLGNSAAGYYLLQNTDIKLLPAEVQKLKQAHFRPQPPVQLGPLLGGLSCVTAAEDISDGLSASLGHICRASEKGCIIKTHSIPIDPTVRKLAEIRNQDPLAWALQGGEDYELVFTVRPEFAKSTEAKAAALGEPLFHIGEIVAPQEGCLLDRGQFGRFKLSDGGYDAFGDL